MADEWNDIDGGWDELVPEPLSESAPASESLGTPETTEGGAELRDTASAAPPQARKRRTRARRRGKKGRRTASSLSAVNVTPRPSTDKAAKDRVTAAIEKESLAAGRSSTDVQPPAESAPDPSEPDPSESGEGTWARPTVELPDSAAATNAKPMPAKPMPPAVVHPQVESRGREAKAIQSSVGLTKTARISSRHRANARKKNPRAKAKASRRSTPAWLMPMIALVICLALFALGLTINAD